MPELTRYHITLYNASGETVTSCDFADADAAKGYREQAEQTAKEISGRVEVETKESA